MSEPIAEVEIAALEKGYGLYPANVKRLCAAWREQRNALLEWKKVYDALDQLNLDQYAKIEEQQKELEQLKTEASEWRQWDRDSKIVY